MEGKAICNIMGKTVAGRRRPLELPAWQAEAGSLYAPNGARKYLNAAERERALAAMRELPPDQALFALTLAWTGARVSEVLALTPASFQIEHGVVVFRTLKQRRQRFREVPIPPGLTAALDHRFGLSAMRRDPRGADHRLWPWHRVTAWRVIKRVMRRSQVKGRQACPRGLRHAFGVGTLLAKIPPHLTQRWMGHARISTTAIYADAVGPEERAFASRFWSTPAMRRLGPSGQQLPR